MTRARRATVARLRQLLRARDDDQISQGAALAASLGDPEVTGALLTGCAIRPDGRLERGRIFDSRDRARQPALDRALLAVVATAPEAAAIHPSLRRGAVTRLNLSNLPWADHPLRSLPPELGALHALAELDLSFNQLDADALAAMIPILASLPALRSLDLGLNALAALPPEIGALRGLRALRLRSNPLAALPATLYALPLASLDLYGCRLTAAPLALARMGALETVNLRNNPLAPGSLDALRAAIGEREIAVRG